MVTRLKQTLESSEDDCFSREGAVANMHTVTNRSYRKTQSETTPPSAACIYITFCYYYSPVITCIRCTVILNPTRLLTMAIGFLRETKLTQKYNTKCNFVLNTLA